MDLAELRRRAEERISADWDLTETRWSERDPSELIRELRLQAVCLELQNEELRRARKELAAERDRSRTHAGELRESLERFSQIAERLEDVFYIIDLSGRPLYASPAFETVYGRPMPPERDLSTVLEWIMEEDRTRVRDAFERALKGDPFDEEYRVIHPDRSIRIIRDRAVPVENEEGRVVRLTGIAQDVTDERKLEEELRQAQKMEAIGTFVGGVAHDFNNLLMAITGCAHLALENLDERHPAHRLVKRSADAAWRGASLTRRLLGLVRRQSHRPEQAELDTLVAASEELLRRLLGEHIRLRVETGAQGRRVLADPGELEQVLMNLAANARDALTDGGDLTIRTTEIFLGDAEAEARGISPGRYVALRVTDTGCGMDEETRKRIFEPFFTTKARGRGTGLGLSTAFAIIKQMRGDVTVESEPGGGTTFTVCLPVLDQSEREERLAPEETPRGNGIVLLVEDDRLVRLTVRRYLEGLGYRPVVAASPKEALWLCDERLARIDVLLTDVILPGRMGRDLAREVSLRWPDVHVLYMSAHPGDELAELQWLEPGAPLLQKPFDETGLGAALQQLLGETTEVEEPATLLVVEDSDTSRVAMREYLEDLGYRVLAAARPSHAIELARSEAIDVLVTDMALPEMGGQELVDRIHELWPDAPVIMLSGYPEFVLGTRDRLLEKPVDPGRLAAEIRRSLSRRG